MIDSSRQKPYFLTGATQTIHTTNTNNTYKQQNRTIPTVTSSTNTNHKIIQI